MMARGVRSSSGQRSLMVVVTLALLHLLRTVMSYSSGVGAATEPLQDSDVFSQSQFSTRPLGFLRSQAVWANKLVGSSGGGMRCEIGSHLVAAVIDMINTITPTHLHLVSQHDPESCLVEGLWEKGVGVAVMGYTHWWGLLQQSSYLLPSQHILVGDIYWISTIMVQVKPLYNSGKINAVRTRWMWVSTSLPTTLESLPAASSFPVITAPLNLASDIPDRHSIRVVPSSSSPSSPPAGAAFISSRTKTSESQPFNAEKIITRHHNTILSSTVPMSQSFLHALDVVSDALQEGMRGVLLADLHQQSTSSAGNVSLSAHVGRKQRTTTITPWVAVGGVEAPGDGSWRLVVAASWTNKHLDTYRPLWPPLSYNLHQRVVRLTCTQKPTVFEFADNATRLADARGYAADLLRLIQKRLNFSDVILPVVGFGSIIENGSWNGMIGVLSRQEADMGPLDFSPDAQRSQVVEFGEPYSMDGVVILCEAPSILVRPFLLLNIFSPLVWACLVGVAMAAGVFVGGVVVAEARLLDSWAGGGGRSVGGDRVGGPQPVKCFTSVFKIFLYQSSRCWPGNPSGRVVSAVVMLVALVVGSLYSGFITAFLAIPFRSVPVNSAEDLVQRDMIPVFRAKTTVYNFILKQKGGVLGQLKARMKTVESEVLTTWQFLSKVADGTYALLDTYSSAVGRAQKYERRGEQCKYHLARHSVRVDFDTFAFARNSFLIHQFDEIMRRLRHGGIIGHMQKQYYQLPCESVQRQVGPEPMSLAQVQGAFYVLGTGVILATSTLLTEIVVHACCRKSTAHHLSGLLPGSSPWVPSFGHLDEN